MQYTFETACDTQKARAMPKHAGITRSLLSSSNSLNSASFLPSRFTVLSSITRRQMANCGEAAAAVNVFRDSLKETTPLYSTLWLRSRVGLVVGSRRQRTLLKFMVFVVSERASKRDNSPAAAISAVRSTERTTDRPTDQQTERSGRPSNPLN